MSIFSHRKLVKWRKTNRGLSLSKLGKVKKINPQAFLPRVSIRRQTFAGPRLSSVTPASPLLLTGMFCDSVPGQTERKGRALAPVLLFIHKRLGASVFSLSFPQLLPKVLHVSTNNSLMFFFHGSRAVFLCLQHIRLNWIQRMKSWRF